VEKKKIITITKETCEVFAIRLNSYRSGLTWCAQCAAEVEMLTPDEAAMLARTSVRSIFRRTELGQLHFSETPAGKLFICLHSLTSHAAELLMRD
jgi:hypothetical protein